MGYLIVHRKGFYIHRNGKRIYIPPTTYKIKDRGKKGRGKKVLPKLKEGELKKFGYSLKDPARIRHIALGKAIRRYGYKNLLGKILALRVLFKHTNPTYSRRALADIRWLVENYGRRR